MAYIYDHAYLGDKIVPFNQATLSVASSAVMYGLSVYTVLPVHVRDDGTRWAFRLADHYRRLVNSSRIIGIDTFESAWSEDRFVQVVTQLIQQNDVEEDVFVRVTVHVDELVAGVRSRGLSTQLSMFVYRAVPILSQAGARLKTTTWRRVADAAIPPRAKVNGAYVNSVLGKQEALDSGYDDCIFLDGEGHVCELSAANIFLVRGKMLITPGANSDLLEGISRSTLLMLAKELNISIEERVVDRTELYVADEVFSSGTSAYLAPVVEIDGRPVGDGTPGQVSLRLREQYLAVLRGKSPAHSNLVTAV